MNYNTSFRNMVQPGFTQSPIGAQNRPRPHNFNYPRTLMHQLVTKYINDSERVSYVMDIIQLPIRNDQALRQNMVTLQFESEQLPWIVIRNTVNKNEQIAIPLSLCDQLLNSLLSCAEINFDENNDINLTDQEGNDESGQKHSIISVFDLSKLEDAQFENEKVNRVIRITSQDPGQTNGTDDMVNQQGKFWVSSTPLVATEASAVNVAESAGGNFRASWLKPGFLQLYEELLPNLAAFLTDVKVRYRQIEQKPIVECLFSPSGDRRFYFDVRNTRWGNRLHVSQVTEFYRNVIAIPLESVIEFRDNISTLIKLLNLEEGEGVRQILKRYSTRPTTRRPRKPNFTGDSHIQNFQKIPPQLANDQKYSGGITQDTQNPRTRQISFSNGKRQKSNQNRPTLISEKEQIQTSNVLNQRPNSHQKLNNNKFTSEEESIQTSNIANSGLNPQIKAPNKSTKEDRNVKPKQSTKRMQSKSISEQEQPQPGKPQTHQQNNCSKTLVNPENLQSKQLSSSESQVKKKTQHYRTRSSKSKTPPETQETIGSYGNRQPQLSRPPADAQDVRMNQQQNSNGPVHQNRHQRSPEINHSSQFLEHKNILEQQQHQQHQKQHYNHQHQQPINQQEQEQEQEQEQQQQQPHIRQQPKSQIKPHHVIQQSESQPEAPESKQELEKYMPKQLVAVNESPKSWSLVASQSVARQQTQTPMTVLAQPHATSNIEPPPINSNVLDETEEHMEQVGASCGDHSPSTKSKKKKKKKKKKEPASETAATALTSEDVRYETSSKTEDNGDVEIRKKLE